VQGDFPEFLELQTSLRELARRYVDVALRTPLAVRYGPGDVILTLRAAWLRTNVLNPCHRLLVALGDENAPNFSDWPDHIELPQPARATIIAELHALEAWAGRLHSDLCQRVLEKANHSTEFERDVVFAIADVFRTFFPGQPIARGTYDRKHGRTSRFTAFVRRAAFEIFQEDRKLERAIKDVVKSEGS
jgi:hypothetical protein